MGKNFTTKTASIKATRANVRKLDAKEIKLKDKNILEYFKDAIPTIKHAQDTRETVTENDLWGQWVETLEDGTVILHDDEVTNPNGSSSPWNTSITKVEDNKAYVGEDLFANIQIEKINDGSSMFKGCSNLTTFTSDLSSLTNGSNMFNQSRNLTTFTSDLSSLRDGSGMFNNCSKLTKFTSDLSSLTNGSNMFISCAFRDFLIELASLINGHSMFQNCKLDSFGRDLKSLTNGYEMFNSCSNLTTFTSDLSSLTNGSYMFKYCSNLTTFTSDLSSLVNGHEMFYNCKKLTSYNRDLSSLKNGCRLFSYCTNFTTFIGDLSAMTDGTCMFQGSTNLTTFTSDLSSLIKGYAMFNNCSKLTTFTFDLSSLINGYGMFHGCTNLTTFTSDLSSLINGYSMFNKTKLSPQSVMYIAGSIKDIVAEKQLYIDGTIPYVTLVTTSTPYNTYSALKGFMSDGSYAYTYTDGTYPDSNYLPYPQTLTISAENVGQLTIGIDVTNDANTIEQQLQTFAEGALFDSWDDLKQAFVDKGWTVTWQYGATADSITYDIRGGEKIIPCPVYTKLIEILPEGIEHDENGNEVGEKFYTEEQKSGSEYCNEDGSKFYNIEWGHDVTHPEEFQQFESLEAAEEHYGLIRKEESAN